MAKRNLDKTGSEASPAPERRRRTTTDSTSKTPAAARSRGRRKTDAIGQADDVQVAGAPSTTSTGEVPAALKAEAAIVAPAQPVPPAEAATASNGNGHESDRPLPHEDIAVRAYHLYLERGGQPGDQFQDWVTAERQLREQFERANS